MEIRLNVFRRSTTAQKQFIQNSIHLKNYRRSYLHRRFNKEFVLESEEFVLEINNMTFKGSVKSFWGFYTRQTKWWLFDVFH